MRRGCCDNKLILELCDNFVICCLYSMYINLQDGYANRYGRFYLQHTPAVS